MKSSMGRSESVSQAPIAYQLDAGLRNEDPTFRHFPVQCGSLVRTKHRFRKTCAWLSLRYPQPLLSEKHDFPFHILTQALAHTSCTERG